jgi:peptidyl-tRNA hydrolase
MKAYFILRKDLNMTPAKLGVQVGHGVDFVHFNCSSLQDWISNDRRKIVCQVVDEAALQNIKNILENAGIGHHLIIDKGLTEFNGETTTGIVIYPTNDLLPGIVRHLPTYK